MIDTDPLDELLTRNAPPTAPRTPGLREELTRMAVSSADGRRASRSRRRIAIGTGITTVALLAGAGTAAATGVVDWAPWAQDPDAVYEYTLPSGEACELRVVFDDEATGAAARDILAEAELGSRIDVDAVIARLRATPNTVGDEFGNSWDGGYGTEYYPGVDEEYDRAMQFAVTDYLFGELNERGVAPRAQDATSASTCSIRSADGR
ncbi:MAG: hypothetical protein QM598_07495 [Protaetiibacter sp.]